ncbi:MAG: ABC transporter ATP-binding protein [Clostridia bacterium]|nr:ABC transporter ATP-binding protein [Clostridia bacterium]
MMSISLKNVSYNYKGKYQTVRAVDGVSYDFEAGKCYAIIGKSGSGKTTLLSLMAGLDLPTEGEIIVDGKSTKDWDRNRMRREAVSVIYQNYNLFPLLTVQENIQYPLDLKKVPKKEAEALGRKVRERVDLSENYDKRMPAHLSGGEQQRVAIARTLAQGCKIILADEPTGNLDSTNTRNIVDILCTLAHDDGCTVIIVTHDPSVAEQADTVLQMKDGAWI